MKGGGGVGKMKILRDEAVRRSEQVLDVFLAVDEMHNMSSRELIKILRGSQDFTVKVTNSKGAIVKVDVERLMASLPLHLLACAAAENSDHWLWYLLRGIRLLHSLCELSNHPWQRGLRPERPQMMLHDVKVQQQMVDLVFFLLIVLASPDEIDQPELRDEGNPDLLLVTLVASCLYLFPAFISTEWEDIVPVLLAHPQAEVFMDASVEAVRKSVELLKAKLQAADVMDDGDREGNRLGKGPNAMEEDWSSGGTGSGTTPGLPSSLLELMASHTEASVHALHLMCQSQAFRDRVLQHKELCENGGVMRLAYSVLSLAPPGTSIYTKSLTYTISRMKARILEMVWMLSMAESASFLDKAMENLRSRQVATEVADQVLIHLRAVLLDELEIKDGEFPPGGQLYLNTLRVADVLSDDTNFRRYIMRRVGPSLAAVLASPPTRFVLKWGGGLAALSLGKHEASVVLSYSPFDATGVALSNRHASGNMQSVSRASVHPGGLSSSQGSLLQGSVTVKPGEPKAELHSKERSALLIKLVGNLHYYAEGGDECRSQFLKIFVEGLRNHPPLPGSSQRPEQIHINLCENLFTLVDYVATFPEELVTDEDLHLVRDFSEELHSEVCRVPSAEGCDEEDIICFYKMHNNRQIKLKEARKNNPRFRRLDGLRRDNLANARLGEEADDIVRQEWVEEDRGMIEYLRSSGPEPDGGLPEDLNNRLAEDRERGTGAADESSVRRDQTLTLFLGEPEPWVDNSSHCSLPANQEHREKEQCLEPSERMLARRTDLELRQPRDTPLDHLWAVQTLEGGMQQEEERQLGYAKEPRKDIRGNLTSKANDEDHDENVDDGHGNEHGADDNDDDAGPMEELSAQRRDFSGHQQIRSLRGRASGIRRKDGEDSSQHEKEEKAKRSDKTSLESDGQEALQGEFEEDGNEEEGEEETADEFAEEEMPPELELWDRAKPSKRKREKEKESSRKEKRLRAAETEREEREGEDDVDVEKGDQQEPDDDDGEESRSKGVNAKKGRRKGRWGSKERGDVCGGGDDGGDPTDNFCGEDDKEAPPPVKRKGKLMNDQQLVCVESGLRQFPNMHKQSKVIEKFASKIKDMGPEVTPQQLRNWLNNRRAKLARQRRDLTQPSTVGNKPVSRSTHSGNMSGQRSETLGLDGFLRDVVMMADSRERGGEPSPMNTSWVADKDSICEQGVGGKEGDGGSVNQMSREIVGRREEERERREWRGRSSGSLASMNSPIPPSAALKEDTGIGIAGLRLSISVAPGRVGEGERETEVPSPIMHRRNKRAASPISTRQGNERESSPRS